MTIEVKQTCDKCFKARHLDTQRSIAMSPEQGGWRQFSGKDICADCMSKFIGEVNATLPS